MAALAFLLLSPGTGLTVGSVSTVSPRPMGMGGAFMAVEDDQAAMAWNPAGLIRPDCTAGTKASVHINILGAFSIAGETGLLSGTEAEPFGSLSGFEKLTVVLGSVFKSVSIRSGGAAFGVLMLEEQLDPSGLSRSRGLADASYLLGAYYTTMAFAFQLAPSVSIGLSETILSGWEGPRDRRTGTGHAYGVILRPNELVTVGLTYSDLPEGFRDYRLGVEGLSAGTTNAGLAYRPVPRVLMTLDLRDLTERQANTAVEPRAGMEVNLWGKGALRAGAFRENGGRTDVLTLGFGAIPMNTCLGRSVELAGDAFVVNYALLIREEGGPRHLLSAILHF
ncbi:MAG: hypothetical protein JXB46_10130 [Candidatus Eisenbacteria bacterium]|nr:hypothetical protein [Candidatus Eisenbacteria bacterium]